MTKISNFRALAIVAAAVVAALLVTAVMVLVGAREAKAAFPGLNGRIAFQRNGDIWTMDSTGSDQRYLTGGNYDPSEDPAWSPDGTKLAFVKAVAYRPSDYEIFTVNADGSGVRRLTDNASWDLHPAWSPDGTKIAFMRRGASGWDIWVMNSDGSNQRRLTSRPEGDRQGDSDPAWSPDGRKIAFSRNFYFLYVMNADGTGQRRLSSSGGIGRGPDWSPDGTKLVFSRYRPGNDSEEIGMINTDGTGETFLTDSAEDEHDPAFSPDGRFITFESCLSESYPSSRIRCPIRKMRSDGAAPVDLTNPPFNELQWDPSWQPLPAFVLSDNALAIPFRDIILVSGRFVYGGATMTSGRELTLWEQTADSYKDFAPCQGPKPPPIKTDLSVSRRCSRKRTLITRCASPETPKRNSNPPRARSRRSTCGCWSLRGFRPRA
jgi:dipeptidyl aminopeptidase/acylaminoacyl peptidase